VARLINKSIFFEKHALKRLEQRGISRSQVEKAICDPHHRQPATRKGAWKVKHNLDGVMEITAVFEEGSTAIRVITAWISHA